LSIDPLVEPKPSPSILAPIIIFLGIFAITLVVPPLGLIISVILPTPLILVFLANGRMAGLIAAGLIFLLLLALAGPNQAIVFLGEFAVMAMVMAEAIKARFPFEKCIAFSAGCAAVVSLVLLFSVHAGSEKSAAEFFQEQIQKGIEQTMASVEDASDGQAVAEDTLKFAEESAKKLASAYPAFLAVGLLVTAIINYFAVMFVWPRLYGTAPFAAAEVSRWVLPDQFIWPLILSGLAAFFASGGLQVFGLNIFVLFLVIYFLQGMAIVVYLLVKKSVPTFFRVIIFVIIFTQPLFIGILIGTGVFDLWVDFRKIRVAGPESPDKDARD